MILGLQKSGNEIILARTAKSLIVLPLDILNVGRHHSRKYSNLSIGIFLESLYTPYYV